MTQQFGERLDRSEARATGVIPKESNGYTRLKDSNIECQRHPEQHALIGNTPNFTTDWCAPDFTTKKPYIKS